MIAGARVGSADCFKGKIVSHGLPSRAEASRIEQAVGVEGILHAHAQFSQGGRWRRVKIASKSAARAESEPRSNIAWPSFAAAIARIEPALSGEAPTQSSPPA